MTLGLGLWACGAHGWFDEVREFLRGDDQGDQLGGGDPGGGGH